MGKISHLVYMALGLLSFWFLVSCNSDTGTTSPPPAECSLTFTTPAAGASFQSGDPVNIRWDREGTAPTVMIELMQAGQQVGIITASADNNGFFPWNADVIDGVGGDFTLRITALGQDGCQSESGVFALANTAACDIELTVPTIPESIFVAGQDLSITWNSHDTMGDVGIELLHGHLNQVLVGTIAEKTPDDGSYVWTIDSYNDAVHRDVSDDSLYWLRIFDWDIPGCEDRSPDFTLIDTDLCTIDVYSSLAGPVVDEGVTITIGINAYDNQDGEMIKIRLYAGSLPVPGGYITPPGQDIPASTLTYEWEVQDYGFIGGTLSNVRVIRVDDEYCYGKTGNFAIRSSAASLGGK